MTPFIWTKEYETGIVGIDIQHQELFNKIDTLTLAIYSGECKKVLLDLFIFLDIYVTEHFNHEEYLFKASDYPQVDHHIQLHKDFKSLFREIKHDFERKGGGTYLCMRVEKEIRKWWEEHIRIVDMNYVSYVLN